MKSLVILLAVAGLHASSAFALSAAGEAADDAQAIGKAIKGDSRDAIRPNKGAVGSKVTAPGVTGNAATSAAGSTATDKTAQALTGVNEHNSCKADSGMALISGSQRDAVYEAQRKHLGGKDACLSNMGKEAVANAADMYSAELEKLKQIAATGDFSSLTEAQQIEVLQAGEAKLADVLGEDKAEAADTVRSLCDNGCDVVDEGACKVAAKL
jgi:hypothetical protein